MTGDGRNGAAAALRGRAERPDYVEMLPHIAAPTLVVVGRDDEFTPVRDAKFIYERIPNATLMVIERAGHMPNLGRPAEFNVAVARFLTSVATTPVHRSNTHRVREWDPVTEPPAATREQ